MPYTRTLLALFFSLALFSNQAQAAGYAIIEHGVKGLGNAYAGGSASADDASTIYFNPAGMSLLDGKQMIVAGHIIIPTADFKNQGSVNAGSVAITGGNDDGGATAFVPNFYWTFPINEKMRFGLGVNAPFGLETSYDSTWVGRYHAIDSELRTLNINPSLSFKLSDKSSIGVGISVQYADATLSNMLDLNGLQTADVIAKVDGSSWGIGFNIGYLHRFSERTRLGIAYRSKIDHTLDGGKASFTPTNPTAAATLAGAQGGGSLLPTGVEADVTFPETLSVSMFHQVNSKWAIMGDITWTKWSHFDELVIEFDVGNQGDNVTPENWDDSWRIAFGANYKLNDRWLLRFGAALDQTPIPNSTFRTPRIPGNDRKWVTFGASFKGSGKVSFDFGFAHLFVSDTKVNNVSNQTPQHRLIGEYSADVNILSFQANWDY